MVYLSETGPAADQTEKHVGFTGTQDGMTEAQSERVSRLMTSLSGWFHHGDCIGADKQSNDLARQRGLMVAAPKSFAEELRSGTWATVRYARKQKKPVVIVFPDGSVQNVRT